MIRAIFRRRIVRDLSANTIQTGTNQVFALAIFYFLSRFISKDDFGEYQWSLAVCSTIIAVGSLGLDLVFVKRLAAGTDVVKMSGIHLLHSLIAALVPMLFIAGFFFADPGLDRAHPLLLFVFIAQATGNIANSFKLCMNGLEAYRNLAWLSVATNALRLLLVVGLFVFGYFTIRNVIAMTFAAFVFEAFAGYVILRRILRYRIRPMLRPADHVAFIVESLPQLGIVLFDSALARLDWILLGLIGTAAATAEYSFTYKVFEISKLPLLIIAPVLLTRFTKLLSGDKAVGVNSSEEIRWFLQFEMFVLLVLTVILCSCWTPLIDHITADKYGAVNEHSFYLLAACVPLHVLINFYWTLAFVQDQLRVIMFITIATSVLNVLLNILLIPHYGGEGAALSFLIASAMQFVLYLIYTKRDKIRPATSKALLLGLIAALSVVLARMIFENVILCTVFATVLYVGISMISRLADVRRIAAFRKS